MTDKNKRIELADQDATLEFEKEIDEILEAIGFPGSMVTDESEFRDFLIWIKPDDPEIVSHNKEIMDKAGALLMRPVERTERLWKMARDLYFLKKEKLTPKPAQKLN